MKEDYFDLEKLVYNHYVYSDKLFIEKFTKLPYREAIIVNIQDAVRQLIKAQCKFIFLYDSFNTIRGIKQFYNTLTQKEKRSLNQMIKGIVCIVFAINEVLMPISEGINND